MIELKLNGKTYTGWTSASVRRALNSFASSFELAVSQKYHDGGIDIPLDAPCEVLVDGISVITGYIDEVLPDYSATSHTVTFAGRSKTADLVDCSAILDAGQIINSDLATITRKILAPFKLKAVLNNLSERLPVADFQLQPGETAAAAIKRLCSVHALIYYDNAQGDLVLSKVEMGTSGADIIHKVTGGNNNNVLSGAATYSRRDRFSHYYVKSQITGSDFVGGEDITAIQGDAVDSDMPRFRPLITMAESGMPQSQAVTRAQWEKASRAGKSVALEYSLQGWRNSLGELWTPNTYINVNDDFIKVKGKLIITEVDFKISADGGTTTKLKITPPEAFIPSPKAPSKSTGGGGNQYWPELIKGV